ncbi:unnamed protein product [Camellia sinensis]
MPLFPTAPFPSDLTKIPISTTTPKSFHSHRRTHSFPYHHCNLLYKLWQPHHRHGPKRPHQVHSFLWRHHSSLKSIIPHHQLPYYESFGRDQAKRFKGLSQIEKVKGSPPLPCSWIRTPPLFFFLSHSPHISLFPSLSISLSLSLYLSLSLSHSLSLTLIVRSNVTVLHSTIATSILDLSES